MTDFSLRHVITDVLVTTELADPTEVADETFRRLTEGQHADALRQSLRQMARLVISSQRNAHTPRLSASSAKSAKVIGIREMWRQRLMDRICGADGWKLMRDSTHGDLLFAAGVNRSLAAENIAAAERAEKVAAAVEEHGVVTVGELPEAVLAELFGGAA